MLAQPFKAGPSSSFFLLPSASADFLFLKHDSLGYAGKNLIDPKAVVSEGVVGVLRYPHVARRDQVSKFPPQGELSFPAGSGHWLERQ